MPLPSTSLLGFSAPVVKAGELVIPVLVRGERHGLRMSVPMAREIAEAILAATAPDACAKHGPRPFLNLTEAAAAGSPLLRPGATAL